MTEEKLYNIFKTSTLVANVKICRDSATGNSRGYGYVNFHSTEDAENALKHLNFARVDGHDIRLMWAQPNAAQRRSGVGNLVITNLDVSVDNKTLFDTFSVFGPILSSRVIQDAAGQSMGYGFVHYEHAEDAARALTLNGNKMMGKSVRVSPFRPRAQREPAPAEFTNVYVKDFARELFASAEAFRAFFEAAGGEVTSVHFPLDEGGAPRGFGFVNFAQAAAARRVVTELHQAAPYQLYVARALSKAQRRRELQGAVERWRRELDRRTAGRNVFVKNLPDAVDGEQLRAEFARFGAVESAKVEADAAGRSKCFGYVLFAERAQATDAIKAMNMASWAGKTLAVALWQRRGARQAQRPPRPGFEAQSGFVMPQQAALYSPQMYPQLYPQLYQQQLAQRLVPAQLYPQPVGRQQPAQGERWQQLAQGGRRQLAAQSEEEMYQRGGRGDEYEAVLRREQAQREQLAAQLAAEEGEESVGDQLYRKLFAIDPLRAGKIAGMFIEQPLEEQVKALDDEKYFLSKVRQAQELLENANIM